MDLTDLIEEFAYVENSKLELFQLLAQKISDHNQYVSINKKDAMEMLSDLLNDIFDTRHLEAEIDEKSQHEAFMEHQQNVRDYYKSQGV